MARILIVDDEEDVVNFIAKEFTKRDYEVETALSGEEAIEKVKETRPHLMLLDIRMPGMGGIAALRQAKEFDPHLGVMELGAHDYVTKPIDFNYLNLTVMTKIVDLVG